MLQGKTFVLVHGAWHGGWCYTRVAERLSARGGRVFAPTLTGLGERSHLYDPQINLTTHVLDVANLIRWHELRDIVLVGHSYGGMVITAVADQLAERIGALVYLDAFLPEDNQCLHDLAPPEMVRAQLESATVANRYAVPPIPAAVFNVNPADREWVDRLCTPQPLATLTERVRLTGRFKTVPHKTYVLAGDFPGSPFGMFCDALATQTGWQTCGLPCGHDVMIDMPDETANIIAGA
jgi:pimeloyl-ACP methyl ester carboxylesterase